MKKVLAACIDQILLFDSANKFEVFQSGLKFKKQSYSVDSMETLEDGKVKVRIRKQYNNNAFIGKDVK